jgi:hypothetical protein
VTARNVQVLLARVVAASEELALDECEQVAAILADLEAELAALAELEAGVRP